MTEKVSAMKRSIKQESSIFSAKSNEAEDLQKCVKDLRARFYGALPELLPAAIEYARKAKDGGWLAYQMLKDAGVIPQQESKNKVQVDCDRTVKSDDDLQREIGYGLVNAAIEQHKYFDLRLPEAEEMKKEILAKKRKGG